MNKFCSFLNDQIIMLLRGQLRHAEASYDKKHPFLSSAKHAMVRKLIEDAQENIYREGGEDVQRFFRREVIGFLDFETPSEMWSWSVSNAESNRLEEFNLSWQIYRKEGLRKECYHLPTLEKNISDHLKWRFSENRRNDGVANLHTWQQELLMLKLYKVWKRIHVLLPLRGLSRGEGNLIPFWVIISKIVGVGKEIREWIALWKQSDL